MIDRWTHVWASGCRDEVQRFHFSGYLGTSQSRFQNGQETGIVVVISQIFFFVSFVQRSHIRDSNMKYTVGSQSDQQRTWSHKHTELLYYGVRSDRMKQINQNWLFFAIKWFIQMFQIKWNLFSKVSFSAIVFLNPSVTCKLKFTIYFLQIFTVTI